MASLLSNATSSLLSPFLPSSSSSHSWTYYLKQYWIDESDPRTRYYIFGEYGPEPLIIVMSSYLLFVTVMGPRIMKNRKPYELKYLMMAYNLFNVFVNAYFFVKSLKWIGYGKRLLDFKFPSRDDQSPETLEMIHEVYLYGITKFIDLLDTVFFVLRKKDSQITFLHLYHHTMVPILAWATGKLAPTCQPMYLFSFLNTMVHVIMYSYYALAAFGPKIQKYLWWKKYITIFQLIQFGILIIYGVFNAVLTSGWPMGLYIIGWIQNPFFFFLFYDFYRQSYKRKSKTIVKEE